MVLDFLGIGSTCVSSSPVEPTHGGADNEGGLSTRIVENISRLIGSSLKSSDDMADATCKNKTLRSSQLIEQVATGDLVLPRVSVVLSDSQLSHQYDQNSPMKPSH